VAVLWVLLTGVGKVVEKHRRLRIACSFCIGLASAYSVSFAANMVALAIIGDLPPRNVPLPVLTWTLVALVCFLQSVFCAVSCTPAFWAYTLNGFFALVPLLFAHQAFITIFTAAPLFAVAALLMIATRKSRSPGSPTFAVSKDQAGFDA